MDKQPVGQLPDLTQSNNDDEIMVITNDEYNQLKKEKISNFITDLTSTDENNAIVKGTDGKLFTKDFGNASNITEGTLPVSVLPDIPKDKLPDIEITDLPVSGVAADTYAYPSSVTVNAQGQVTAIEEGTPSGANANTDLSNITEAGKEVIRENSGGGLEVCDIGMSLYIDETKGLRRRLNGQIVDINANTQAFLDRLKQIVALYPSLSCTEEEWQSIKSASAFGQVGKFVFNYNPDLITEIVSVRIPAVVNVQGLLDLQNTGLTVDQNTQGLNISAGSTTTVAGLPVQPEAIQYPYFIQIATGQETEVNITNEIELNNPFTLFDSKYSEAPLYNVSWLLANGTYYAKSVYVTAYEALAVENNTAVNAGESVTLPSGTEYVKRGLSVKLSTDEDITDYDYVINTSDETFRLPLKNGQEGVFARGAVVEKSGLVVAGVVPEGWSLYYYVGETVQNANLIDAGRIAENYATKQYATSASFPSDRYIDLTPGASGSTYTAPADGWFKLSGMPSNASFNNLFLVQHSQDLGFQAQGIATSLAIALSIPVNKGSEIEIGYTNITFPTAKGFGLRFFYANGSQGGS